MVTARSPTLLLTRPQAQAERFAGDFSRRFGSEIRVIIAPVLRIEPRNQPPGLAGITGLIFTSGNGVRCSAALGEAVQLPAYCVGQNTAALLRARGMHVRMVARDAAELLTRIKADPPGGRLLHLRGVHVRGSLAEDLRKAGQECDELVVYDQVEQSLSPEAARLLSGAAPVLLPLFSPRSAGLVGAAAAGAAAPLAIAALSPAVLRSWSGPAPALARIAETPDAAAMLDALGALIDACHRLETVPRPR